MSAKSYGEFSDISDEELVHATQAFETQQILPDSDDDMLVEASQEAQYLIDNGLDIERFGNLVTDEEMEERMRDSIPKNTQRRNTWAVNTWQKWSVARNNSRIYAGQIPGDKYTKIFTTIEKMDTELLNYWLGKFIMEVRKANGEEYPPRTLLSLVMGLQGYLCMKTNTVISFLESADYQQLRKVLDAEMKRLTQKGLGSNIRKAQAFSEAEIQKLWSSKQLGDYNPSVLVHTLLFLNGVHFGLRGGKEHRDLRYQPSQITLHEPTGKLAYLEYKEDASKAAQGGLKHRRVSPKRVLHHANHACPERCHVRLYKKYLELSPKTNRNNIFYLQPLQNPRADLWYSRQAYGVNTLGKFVKEMCMKAGIPGHRTNHSLRATTATMLFQKGIDEQLIMDRTGHRSVEGVRSYKRISDEQKTEISTILNESSVDETTAKEVNLAEQNAVKTVSVSDDVTPGKTVQITINFK